MRQLELYKYNPGQCSPEEIEATFVSREAILEEILNDLRARAKSPTNQHFLIIGPRGIGKTTLLIMIRHRVMTDESLRCAYLPLQTAEEEYSIDSLRDLFAKTLNLLMESETSAGLSLPREINKLSSVTDSDRVISRGEPPLTLSSQIQASETEAPVMKGPSQVLPESADAKLSTVADLPTLLPTPDASNRTPFNGCAKLVILRNGPVGKTYLLDAPEIRIGRWDADNGHFPEIDLTDDDIDRKISRSHAKITSENGQYFIEDLGSLNGTFVNRSKRLVQGQKAPLNDGDELIMGKLFFRFEMGKT